MHTALVNRWPAYPPSSAVVSDREGMLSTGPTTLFFGGFIWNFWFRTASLLPTAPISVWWREDRLLTYLTSDTQYHLFLAFVPVPDQEPGNFFFAFSAPTGPARKVECELLASFQTDWGDSRSTISFTFEDPSLEDFGQWSLRRYSPSGFPVSSDPGMISAKRP